MEKSLDNKNSIVSYNALKFLKEKGSHNFKAKGFVGIHKEEGMFDFFFFKWSGKMLINQIGYCHMNAIQNVSEIVRIC